MASSAKLPEIPVGQTFGKRTVLAAAPPPSGKRRRFVIVACTCGSIDIVELHRILSGVSQSCATCSRHANAIHGKTETPEYRRWTDMRNRCNNPNNSDFVSYGGAGVRVCPEWDNFEVFLHDMGACPSPSHSIDRIAGGKSHYCPENCRWATPLEQSNNRPDYNRKFTLNGRTQNLSQWGAEIGINPTGIMRRLSRGWSLEDALTTPPVPRGKWFKRPREKTKAL